MLLPFEQISNAVCSSAERVLACAAGENETGSLGNSFHTPSAALRVEKARQNFWDKNNTQARQLIKRKDVEIRQTDDLLPPKT